MPKLLVVFMLCLAIGITCALRFSKDRKDFSKFDRKPLGSIIKQKSSKFCSNNSMTEKFLKDILLFIENLELNSTSKSILKIQSNHLINYLKNQTNHELLQNNCEQFLQGFKLAKQADQNYVNQQKQLGKILQKKFKEILQNIHHEFDI